MSENQPITPCVASTSPNKPQHSDGRWPFETAPRCGAKTRKGTPCQQAAVRGKKRCRMHGGAKGSGAPAGKRNGNYRHGRRTNAALRERQVQARLRKMIGDMTTEADLEGVLLELDAIEL